MYRNIQEAVTTFLAGGVVIFPTDTVWGIGAFVGSNEGIEKLYSLKQRDASKPTALLVGSLSQATDYGEFSEKQLRAVSRFWPGGLTVIVPSKQLLPHHLLNENGGVGIRWPQSAFIDEVTRILGGGLVTSSANVAGGMTPTTLAEISNDLLNQADMLIDAHTTLSGTSSTVVDLMNAEPRVIRQGLVVYREDE